MEAFLLTPLQCTFLQSWTSSFCIWQRYWSGALLQASPVTSWDTGTNPISREEMSHRGCSLTFTAGRAAVYAGSLSPDAGTGGREQVPLSASPPPPPLLHLSSTSPPPSPLLHLPFSTSPRPSVICCGESSSSSKASADSLKRWQWKLRHREVKWKVCL